MALPAAMGDYYGWMLAERVYGLRSVESTAVVCSAMSSYQLKKSVNHMLILGGDL